MTRMTVMAAALAVLGTSAYAGDLFDTRTADVTLESGALAFTLKGENGEATAFEATGLVFSDAYFDIATSAYALGSYDRANDTVTLGGVVAGERAVALGGLNAYALGELDYTAPAEDLGEGEWVATPTLGVYRLLSDRFTVFGDVSQDLNLSDTDVQVGTLEVGADILVRENVMVTPSITRTFNEENEDPQVGANLDVVLRF